MKREVTSYENTKYLRLYYKLDESGGDVVYDSSVRLDEDWKNTISTSFTGQKGIAWDLFDFVICKPHQIKRNSKCISNNFKIIDNRIV
jgi:hypothetical protein